MRARTLSFVAAAAALGVTVSLTASAAAASGTVTSSTASSPAAGSIPRPNHDHFYRYDGSKGPLRTLKPGTPLRTRKVTIAISSTQTLPAEQVLYRTTDATGHAVASVTTFALPATGTVDPKVVAYLSFYDALGPQCDPSYILRGGNPGSANQENATIEQGAVNALVSNGYIVTDPDFEDERLDYVSGTESGMSSLDALKATLAVLKLPQKTTPVGLMGYSGGSIASDWASELAPTYAPKMDLVGVAEGGVPVDLPHNLTYINGSPSWSDVMPAAIIGITRSYHIKLRPYLSKFGRKVVHIESHQCISQFLGRWPGLKIQQLVKKRYADVFQIPTFRRIANSLIMGSVRGHPQEPLLMVAGNQDGTGDGVMVEGDEQALAYEYCKQGMSVDFDEIQGASHDDAGAAWFPAAFSYLGDRFSGAPAPSNCGTFGKGNSLAPIKAKHHHH